MAQNKFETGLCCNCFESCGYCCLGFCLPCVGSGLVSPIILCSSYILIIKINRKTNNIQNALNKVMEKFNGESWAPHAAFYLLWSCIGCPCIMAMDRRSKIRKQFNIEGGACTDCLATCCCEPVLSFLFLIFFSCDANINDFFSIIVCSSSRTYST